ncbi:MAG: flavodoxin family protein [Candidatus Accumulibacter sp.]|jgi:multimeric flavodoxin WrbA|nr:flavodoxin family protein [Accumulibacter sp.]
MKLLIIVAGRKNGNSFQTMTHCLKSNNLSAVEYSIVDLSEKKIAYCDGCLSCDETGKCHIVDDMNAIVLNAKDSDAMAFFSPVRWSLLSGDLKVMLDRLNPLAASEELSGKKAVAICIGQTDVKDDVSISRALDSIRFFCENAGISFIGECAIGNCLESGDVCARESDLIKATETFKKLLQGEVI